MQSQVDDLREPCMSPTKFKECFKAVTPGPGEHIRHALRADVAAASASPRLLRMISFTHDRAGVRYGGLIHVPAVSASASPCRETGLLPSEHRRGDVDDNRGAAAWLQLMV